MNDNLTNGIPLAAFNNTDMVLGKIGEEEILVVRNDDGFFAVGAHCTHYHGPLNEGLIVGDTIRCPWHHSCFDLKTGEALRAPAFDPIACYNVHVVDGRVVVGDKINPVNKSVADTGIQDIVIVGGGGAGTAAAEMLRREGFDGNITLLTADSYPPYDRPNLSKDFLAGSISEDWLPIRNKDFYTEHQINLILNKQVTSIETDEGIVQTLDGIRYPYDALLIATGAEPIRIEVQGIDTARVHYLRSYADCLSIINDVDEIKKRSDQPVVALIIGASFIGLEVAASLKTRGLHVHVVAPERLPLTNVMGEEVGQFVKSLYESHDVKFHLQNTVKKVDGRSVKLSDGTFVDADMIIVGIGVHPLTLLAERSGIDVDNGILVNQFLETNIPDVYAAGDVARWLNARTNEYMRFEHWVLAELQGQIAARNMIGNKSAFTAAPFFWSQHFDVVINYIGYAHEWDNVSIDGSLKDRDCAITYSKQGKTLAVATINRDLENLESELAFEL